MTTDEKNCAQAAIEKLTSAINGISRALMLEDGHVNAIWNYLYKSEDEIKESLKWLNKIGANEK